MNQIFNVKDGHQYMYKVIPSGIAGLNGGPHAIT